MDKTLNSISRKNIGGANNANTFRSATASSMPASVGSSNIASSAIAGAVGAAVFAAMSKAFAVANVKSAVVSSNITSYPPPIPAWYLKSLKNKISTEATAGNPLSYMASARASKVKREQFFSHQHPDAVRTTETVDSNLSKYASSPQWTEGMQKYGEQIIDFTKTPEFEEITQKLHSGQPLSRGSFKKFEAVHRNRIVSETMRSFGSQQYGKSSSSTNLMSLIPGLDPESFKAMKNTFGRMFSGIKHFLFDVGEASWKDIGRPNIFGARTGLHNIFRDRTTRHDLSEMFGSPREYSGWYGSGMVRGGNAGGPVPPPSNRIYAGFGGGGGSNRMFGRLDQGIIKILSGLDKGIGAIFGGGKAVFGRLGQGIIKILSGLDKGIGAIFGGGKAVFGGIGGIGKAVFGGGGKAVFGGIGDIVKAVFGGIGGIGKKEFSMLSSVAHAAGQTEIGTIFKSLGKFGPIIAGVITAFFALRTAIHLLTEGISHGTEAYRNAARTGHTVSGQFALSSAFAAIGMESPDLAMLQGQFNSNARKFGLPGGDDQTVLGAARAGQLGNVQQLMNMSKEFEEAVKDSARNARQMANVGKSLSDLSIRTSELGREWKTLWSQIAYMLEPAISGVVDGLSDLLGVLNVVVEGLVHMRTVIYALLPAGMGAILAQYMHGTGGNENFSRLAGGGTRDSATASAWEKMGFVFPGAGNTNYQAAIATNTFKTNTLLAQIRDVLAQLPNGGNGYTQSFPTLPSYAQ